MTDNLPIQAVLPELCAVLRSSPNAVLIAPPGAGKTTILAPALLHEEYCDGQILLLSPRRLAARMAAERIAHLLGEDVGGTVGYATRMDSKQSAATRILLLTEGIFRNRIIADPELVGVSVVLFDEVHERTVDSDFGLALALETQAAFRPDLRLLAMSATLDGAHFSALMGAAPIIQSEGQSWPLEHRYVGRRAEHALEVDIARNVRLALSEQSGDILVFLPGVREIDRAADALVTLGDDIILHKLHGNVDPAEQRAATKPDTAGRRKVILATNIAETSLTIDGVRIVIDSGFARRARYDRAAGVTRLVTERASLSAATQRAGRAARQGPGTAYRMWEEAGNGGLPPFDPPEILESDLAPLVLDCALWGESDPGKLRWLDPPPLSALQAAHGALRGLGATDDAGRITQQGRDIAALPLSPSLAHMIIAAARHGQGDRAAMLAILTQERGLGGQSEDIEARLEQFARDNDGRAKAAKRLAQRLAQSVTVKQTSDKMLSVGAMLALAYPDRVTKRRGKDGADWLSVSGRGLRLDPASLLTGNLWLAVSDMQGAASGARITAAAALTEAEIEYLFADQIQSVTELRYDRTADRIDAKARRKLGAIILSEGAGSPIDQTTVIATLVEAVARLGLAVLPWSSEAVSLRSRAVFAGVDILSDKHLLEHLNEWLPNAIGPAKRLQNIQSASLTQALDLLLGWDAKRCIDTVAPPVFISEAGTRHDIDYSAEAGPAVELRVQALFGLDNHPVVGVNSVPLSLSLTSPAGRPIQKTTDLPAFWRGSWRDVIKDMRGRYPKHNWPDEPWTASASLRTKKAQARDA